MAPGRVAQSVTCLATDACLAPRGGGCVWGGGGGGGGTLIFSYIRRLGPFFGVKFLNFNIFLGFQKNEYFLGINIL